MEYIVCDIETTGLNPAYHEISEISILKCSDMTLMSWDIKIEYPRRADETAMFITGQNPYHLASRGRYLKECVDEVDEFMRGISHDPDEIACIGHNNSFDRNWLEKKWAALDRKWLCNYWIDTLAMSKKFTKQMLGIKKTSHALTNVLKVAGLKEIPGAHKSIIDVQNTYRLYSLFLQRGMKTTEFIKLSPTLLNNIVKKTNKKDVINMNDVFDDEPTMMDDVFTDESDE